MSLASAPGVEPILDFVDLPLMDAGLDSVEAVEFQHQVMSRIPWIALPAVIVFDYPSVREICGLLMSKCGIASSRTGGEFGITLYSEVLPSQQDCNSVRQG